MRKQEGNDGWNTKNWVTWGMSVKTERGWHVLRQLSKSGVMRGDGGHALFILLIAVALVAALSYAVTKSGRIGGNADREKAMLDAGLAAQCVAYVERGAIMLEIIGGCAIDEISYELPDGTNESPVNPSNTACFVFHPDGAGLTACGIYESSGCFNSAQMQALAIGETCGNVVYAGESGGHRIYTTLADLPSTTWNDGSSNWTSVAGAVSPDDGLSNTNTLVGMTGGDAPYAAAVSCRNLGEEWYLPAVDELDLLFQNKGIGALDGTFDTSGISYWTSTQFDLNSASLQNFSSGTPGDTSKANSRRVRCVRRD